MPPGLGKSFSPLTPFVFHVATAVTLWWPGGTLTVTVFEPDGPLNVKVPRKTLLPSTKTASLTVLLGAFGKPLNVNVTEEHVNFALTVALGGGAALVHVVSTLFDVAVCAA